MINELKRTMEGTETLTNRKNQDGHYLPRTPGIACSNYHPGEYCTNEGATLLNRMHYFKLTPDINPTPPEFLRCTNELDFFRKFMTSEILKSVAIHTNSYAYIKNSI